VWITWDEGLFQNGAYTQNCKFYVETYDKGRGFEVQNFEICHISRYLGKPWSDSLVVECWPFIWRYMEPTIRKDVVLFCTPWNGQTA
jgi:hypothetical protein